MKKRSFLSMFLNLAILLVIATVAVFFLSSCCLINNVFLIIQCGEKTTDKFNDETSYKEAGELIDEFDDANLYKSTCQDHFYINGSKAILNIDRGISQVLFREIPQTNENFELTFKANLVKSSGNSEMIIGLCDSNPSTGNINNSVGVRIGFRLGDSQKPTGTFICSQWYIEGERTVAGLDDRVWVELDEEYIIKLKTNIDTLDLVVYDENTQVGKVISSYDSDTIKYSFFFIANFYDEGWETGYGYVDYLKIDY